ncbi:hypothetical protein GHT09_016448 [Marmota monax]|uniref:WD repeat-containing protein on Y chromosome n=1 Tax=Marmota monax TaxID=9995 RepID=A0A834UWG5_MARMO|nr:hypothetical protein GHT09_016448 [Marmota monax]
MPSGHCPCLRSSAGLSRGPPGAFSGVDLPPLAVLSCPLLLGPSCQPHGLALARPRPPPSAPVASSFSSVSASLYPLREKGSSMWQGHRSDASGTWQGAGAGKPLLNVLVDQPGLFLLTIALMGTRRRCNEEGSGGQVWEDGAGGAVVGCRDPLCIWQAWWASEGWRWALYIQCRPRGLPVWVMKGHQTSVMHLLINSKNSSILISISRDKNIRVWDMQDYICLQSFCGKLFALGNCPITSACFHETDNTLICSTYSIGILNGYLECQQPMKTGKLSTHSAAVCNVLYSKIFKQVVSGCLHGTVCVWELFTGTKMVDFSVSGTHFVELTSMALDESERCLLTGLRDGTMKMWNYNSGECLLTFPNPDKVEVSLVCCGARAGPSSS